MPDLAKLLKPFVKGLKALGKLGDKLGLPVHPAILGLVLLAVIGLVFYLRRRGQRKAAEAPAKAPAGPAPEAATPAGPPPIEKDHFRKIWLRFRAQLPPVVRRALRQFQPVVVLGSAGSGKSALVSRHTDWQRQARYLFGSHVDDPDLQIYLGSKVLVFEVPAQVLGSTSAGLRDALLRLWRPLFRSRTPTVVVAADPLELARMPVDELRALADALRGKINLLSFVRKRPVEVRLALTHMDAVPGFVDLAELARREHHPLELSAPAESPELDIAAHVAQELSDLAQLRPAALLELPADRYLKVVGFLRDAPSALSAVGRFAEALLVREPLSPQPILSGIHLTSAELMEPASDPFVVAATGDRIRDPLRVHQLAAAGLALLLSSALLFVFFSERGLWRPAAAATAEYASASRLFEKPQRERRLREQITAFVARRSFPSFFDPEERAAVEVVARRIEDEVLESRLEAARRDPAGARRGVLAAALIGLDPSDPLRDDLREETALEAYAHAIEVEPDLLRDYLDLTRALDAPGDPPAAILSPLWRREPLSAYTLFFQRLGEAMKDGELGAERLGELRRRARELTAGIERIDAAPRAFEVATELAAREEAWVEVPSALEPLLIEAQAPELFGDAGHRQDLKGLLGLIEATRIELPPIPRTYLDLCRWIEATLGAHPAMPGEDELEVALGGAVYRAADWLALTRDDRVREAVVDFLSRPTSERPLFFAAGTRFSPLEMNPRTRGTFLFSGRASISGRLTREAVRKRVEPTLACHADVIDGLTSLAPELAADLSSRVAREVDGYAERYASAMDEYYAAFGLETRGSEANLRVVLREMLRGTSPFVQHLVEVAQNARLGISDPSARTLAAPLLSALDPYRDLDVVVTSTEAGAPALDSYLEIARVTLSEIEPAPEGFGGLGLPAGEAAPPASLRDRLSPAGRMALDILTCAEGSKLAAARSWLQNVSLPASLHGPFLEPVREIYRVGRTNIETVMKEVWSRDILEPIEPILLTFPFDPSAAEDAEPEEIARLFHPTTGLFVRTRQRLVAPLFARPDGCRVPFRPPTLPSRLGDLTKRVRELGRALWDESHQPRPMPVVIAPVPFGSRILDAAGRELDARLTLTFIATGETTLVNFNQRPFEKRLLEDWTSTHNAQVGLKLTRTRSREEVYPDPQVESSHFPLLQLLARASRTNRRYTWTFRLRDRSLLDEGQRAELPVVFEVVSDPFAVFELGEAARRTELGAYGSWGP